MRTKTMKFVIPVFLLLNSVISTSILRTQDVCQSGTAQSPVDFNSVPVNIQQSNIKIIYEKITGHMAWNQKLKSFNILLRNNQKALYKVEFYPVDMKTDKITNVKKEYNLHSVSFKIISEHMIKGKSSPMEIQFIHQITKTDSKYSYNRLAFSVLVEPTDDEPDKLLENVLPDSHFEMSGFISALNGSPYFHYLGASIASPCSEDVNWFVFTKIFKISQGVYDAMVDMVQKQTGQKTNNKPVKPLAQRKVYKFGQ